MIGRELVRYTLSVYWIGQRSHSHLYSFNYFFSKIISTFLNILFKTFNTIPGTENSCAPSHQRDYRSPCTSHSSGCWPMGAARAPADPCLGCRGLSPDWTERRTNRWHGMLWRSRTQGWRISGLERWTGFVHRGSKRYRSASRLQLTRQKLSTGTIYCIVT